MFFLTLKFFLKMWTFNVWIMSLVMFNHINVLKIMTQDSGLNLSIYSSCYCYCSVFLIYVFFYGGCLNECWKNPSVDFCIGQLMTYLRMGSQYITKTMQKQWKGTVTINIRYTKFKIFIDFSFLMNEGGFGPAQV